MARAPTEHAAPRDRLADHLPDLRSMLEHQRRFRLEQLAELDALVNDTADGPVGVTSAPADVTDAARREVTVKVAAAARLALADIDSALALLTAGGYGRCRGCRADIPVRMLRAIPTSRWCLNCRQRLTPVDGPEATSRSKHGLAVRAASRTQRGRMRRLRPRRDGQAPTHRIARHMALR